MKITFWNVVRSEWTKLRSIPTGLHGYIIVVAMILIVSPLASFAAKGRLAENGISPDQISNRTLPLSIIGIQLAMLALIAIGTLFITGEYTNGSIRTTLAAVPRRWMVLLAKALVVAVTTLVVVTPCVFIAFLIGQDVLDGGISLTTPGATRALLGACIYMMAIALVGLSLGTIIHNTALTISIFAAVLFIAPTMAALLPDALSSAITPYMLSNVGQSLQNIAGDPWGEDTLLGWWSALGVLGLYIVVPLVAALVRLHRSDV